MHKEMIQSTVIKYDEALHFTIWKHPLIIRPYYYNFIMFIYTFV